MFKGAAEIGLALHDLAKQGGKERGFQAFIRRRQDALTKLLSADPDLLQRFMSFTAALPFLKTSREIRDHLRDYFPTSHPGLPFLLNQAIRLARGRWVPHFAVVPAVKAAALEMAKRYIAGDTVAAAAPALRQLADKGLGVILDPLGEAVVSENEANAYRDRCIQMIKDVKADQPLLQKLEDNILRVMQSAIIPVFPPKYHCPIQIAIKLSALAPFTQWNAADAEGTAAVVKARLRRILDFILDSERQGPKIGLKIDVEEYEFRDLTNRIFKEVFTEAKYRGMERIELAVQMYLTDSLEILQDLVAWSEQRRADGGGESVAIRLVKGAYWDWELKESSQKGYPVPVFTEKRHTDVNMELGIRYLIGQSKSVRLAVASHNLRTFSHALALSMDKKVPMEVSMLYGMNDEAKLALSRSGVPVHVYSPVGPLLVAMAYLARRILENSSQQGFLLQSLLDDKNPAERLTDPAKGLDLTVWPPRIPEPPKASGTKDLNEPFLNEPLVRFFKGDNAQALKKLLLKFRQEEILLPRVPVVIAGKAVACGGEIPDTDPCTGKTISVSAKAGPEEAVQAVRVARMALKSWAGLPQFQRSLAVARLAQKMRENKLALTALLMIEAGKTALQADAEVAEAIDKCEYHARLSLHLARTESNLNFKPKGVVAVISPWNFPLAILTGMATGALAMGNTAVMKPAEQTPLIAYQLLQMMEDAGIPKGAVNFLPGDADTGQALLEAGVDMAAFTGSQKVGREIYEKMMAKGVRVIAETGGKNALIVDSDADPDQVIKTALVSKFHYAGQKCSALDRLIVVGSPDQYGNLVERLTQALGSIKVGDVLDFGNFYGPLIDQEALDGMKKKIAEAKGGIPPQGKLLVDGRFLIVPNNGYFIGPSLFEVADPKVTLFQEETFGPLLTVTRANTLQHALELAMNSSAGLTGGVETQSPGHERFLKERWTTVGNLYFNRTQTGAIEGRQPFGGVLLSGIDGSKAGGRHYLRQFIDAEFKMPPDPREAKAIFEQFKELTLARMNQPETYQPELLGETNQVVYRPKGRGLLVVGPKTPIVNAAALLSIAVHTGNPVCVLSDKSRLDEVDDLLKNLPRSTRRLAFVVPYPESEAMLIELATHPELRWIAFGSESEINPTIRDTAVKTPKGQNFFRSIIATDAWTNFHFVFQQMTLPQTITVNTARHGVVVVSNLTEKVG